MYTIDELSFILFNNRSRMGVVKNFIPSDIDPLELIKIESDMAHFQSIFNSKKFFEINRTDVDESAEDVIVQKSDILSITDKMKTGSLSHIEKNYLNQRGIGSDIIERWKIVGLSTFSEFRELEIINATCHPILRPILEDGISGGGIIIPLFNQGILENCALRKISDIGKLKYSLACPDIDVWGLHDIDGEEIWITEGLFDMMALRQLGLKSVSVSSPTWSSIQIYKLLEKKPRTIVIFCDNDSVGFRTGIILRKFFNIRGIVTKTVISKYSKDAAEHVFQKNLTLNDIEEIHITPKLIESSTENFNLTNYLKNRAY